MFAYYPPEWENLASRIVGRWCPSFSGNTGLQLPDTMGRNHGTLTNFSNNGNDAYVASPDRTALSFDGANDQLNLSSAVAFGTNAPYTLTAWISKTALGANAGNNGGIFRDGNTFLITSENVGRLWGRHSGTTLADANTGPLLLGQGWSHVGITWNGSTASLIFNGSFFTSASVATSTAFSISVIGQQASQFLLAQLDDVTVFNTALTANEVRFIYEHGRGGGMLYQPPRRLSYFAQVTTFKNYWLRNQQRMIGGGR